MLVPILTETIKHRRGLIYDTDAPQPEPSGRPAFQYDQFTCGERCPASGPQERSPTEGCTAVQNGAVIPGRRRREQPDARRATSGPARPSDSAATQSSRRTRQVVFLMLIGWLVVVVLVVVLISVT